MKRLFRAAAGVAAGMLGGCITLAPQSQLDQVTAKFSEVVSKGAAAIAIETNAKSAVRRNEVVMYYLNNPTDPGNISSAGVPRSFINFVCVGRGALSKQTATIEYLDSYADSLSGVTKSGADTFAGQWKKYKELRQVALNDPPAAEVDTKAVGFNQCAKEVGELIKFNGVSATDFTSESAVVALEGLKGLLAAVEQIAKTALKTVNEAESRRLFTELVAKQHENFQMRLSNDLNPTLLDDAWKRRKSSALWRPYRTFARMMELDPIAKRDEIIQLSDEAGKQLAEYDALYNTKPPSVVVVAIANAEQALYEVAMNKNLKPNDVLEFLTVISKDLGQIKKDYDAVGEAAKTALQ